MKIAYKDGSFVEFKKTNDKISVTVSAVIDKKLIVNSAIISMEDFDKIIKEIKG